MSRVKVSPGDHYGQASILEEIEPRARATGELVRRVRCRCNCGNIFECFLQDLRSGNTKSCGCLQVTRTRKALTTHGLTGSREMKSWAHAKDRCVNPNDAQHLRYGGAGVSMCRRYFTSLSAVIDDIGMIPYEKGTKAILSRIDQTGNYSCGKCRECADNIWAFNIKWATAAEAANNRENTLFIEWAGETRNISDWARVLGMPQKTLYYRLRIYLWPVERAFTEPVFIGKNQTHLRDEETLCPALP